MQYVMFDPKDVVDLVINLNLKYLKPQKKKLIFDK